MTTRSKDGGNTNQQDVHTMVSRYPHDGREGHTKSTRSCTFGKTFGNFFNMPKILWTLPKLLPNPKNLSRRSHDGLGCSPEWHDVFTIIPDVANFLHRVSIASQHRDSVTPALRCFCQIHPGADPGRGQNRSQGSPSSRNFFLRPEGYSDKPNGQQWSRSMWEEVLLFLVPFRSQIFDAFLTSFWT